MRRLGFAIVGMGRAGRARARAIAADPASRLVGVVSSRAAESTLSLEGALAHPDIDALYVTTANAQHEALARAGLTAGKHVAVEYPLALSLDAAHALHALAAQQERRLHPLHVELLSESHTLFRERVHQAPLARSALMHFSGDTAGWIGLEDRAGFPSFSGVGRLMRLLDLLDIAEIEACTYANLEGGYAMTATLRTAWGAHVEWCERRAPGLARGTRCEVETQTATLVGYREGGRGGVFERSHAHFCDAIRRPGADAALLALDLRALTLADVAERLARGTLQ